MKKVMLIILDGFGYREEKEGNAILNANMSNYKALWDNYPHTTLYASEEYIGLNEGQFGNSEIGHMTIGAGKVIKNNTQIVDNCFKDINDNEAFNNFIEELQTNQRPLHLVGLLSEGNVHSSFHHWTKLVDAIKDKITNQVYLHVITDGRDTAPDSAMTYINKFKEKAQELKRFSIASVCGRYYAMDRDKKWDRTKLYFDAITRGIAIGARTIDEAIDKSYAAGITDEFIKPFIIDREGLIRDGDNIMWMDYREDRAVQLLEALSNPDFEPFARVKTTNCHIYSFLPFESPIHTTNFTDYEKISNPLGIYLGELGMSQARIAETEKYAHVTYFFDGQNDTKIEKCDKFLIPSPKVATYDLQPEMSAVEVTKRAISCLVKDYDFILLNYVNPDMVGHTGNYDAAIQACNAVDICLGKLMEVAFDNFYKVIIMADHGNCDIMKNEDGSPCTTHTLSKVPFIITDQSLELKSSGNISQVAPTILDYMDIARPADMQETESLIKE